MDKKLKPYTNIKLALALIPTGLVMTVAGWFLGEQSEFFAGMFGLGLVLPIISLPLALFYYIRGKLNVLSYNEDSFTVLKNTYSYKDILQVSVEPALTKRYALNYNIYVKEGCIFTYNDWYENADEFTRMLENKKIKFRH